MSKDRQLTNLRVIGVSGEALDHFVNNNKSFLFLETVSGIKQAMKKNKTVAEICSVNSTNVIAVIEKAGWENALSSSLGYFESEDRFEVCEQINTTLKLLRNERTSKSPEAVS
jgi:hypothetical protein